MQNQNPRERPPRPPADVKRLSGPGHEFTPPSDTEAEQSVLGAILVRPEVLDRVATTVKPDDFYRTAHGVIFQTMLDLQGKNEPVDLVTVCGLLKERGKLEDVGGPAFLAGLSEQVGFATNADHYARKVREKAILRRLLDASQGIAGACLASIENVAEFVDAAGQKFYEACQAVNPKEASMLSELVSQEADTLTKIHEEKRLPGIQVGYRDLARYFAWSPSNLYILAGRPGMGKTALALNFALRVAMQGVDVKFISLEMSESQLTRRIMASMGNIDAERMNRGRMNGAEWAAIYRVRNLVENIPIYIDDRPSQSIAEIRARSRRQHSEGKLGFLILDYLQLTKPIYRSRSREEEVAEVSRGLKALAKELNIPVLALSQLNRKVEDRPNKRPGLSDLRESGAIEADADLVMFIYRDEKYRKDSEDKGKAEVLIEKQRDGRTGMVKLAFLDNYLKFEDLAREEGR